MSSQKVKFEAPAKLKPLLYPARYKAAHGGRGSGKSHFFAGLAIARLLRDPSTSVVCVREVQKSLTESVKRLLEGKIQELGVSGEFDVLQNVIRSRRGPGQIIFQGMRDHSAESLKSLENYDIAWVEEAQSLSQRSLDVLRPTIRKAGSELWFSWNPRFHTDPVDAFFRCNDPPPDSKCVEINYQDNPWFPVELQSELDYDRGRDPDKFAWVWLGGYLKNSETRVFRNWRVEPVDEPGPETPLYFGADWGFATDPTVLVRCYVKGRTLYVTHEAYRVGCEIVDTPALFLTVPDSEKWPIVADSARPETISHLQKNGFPKCFAAVKGPQSVQDGVAWLQGYDIVVDPRCSHLIDELTMYSYKTDPQTGMILPVVEDKHNHCVDSLRYALERARRAPPVQQQTYSAPPTIAHRWR